MIGSDRPSRPQGDWDRGGRGDYRRPDYGHRSGSGYPGKYYPPPPSTISHIRNHFHGYHDYWTPDWYHHHPHAWYPDWIPSYRWWYRPSWYDTWGWYGAGFFTGAVVNEILNPYPYYYGNNIVYRNDMVYVNGVPYVSAAEYYRQAAELARSADVIVVNEAPVQVVQQNVPVLAPADDKDDKPVIQTVAKPVDPANGEDWMAMGTFTVMDSDDGEGKSLAVIQLATNKKGQIRGNYVNDTTNQIRQLVGAVDSKSQRVALHFTDDDKTVLECGLWNLTQDSVPLLVHVGEGETEQLTLIRLTQPDTNDSNELKNPKPSKGPILVGPDEENLAP